MTLREVRQEDAEELRRIHVTPEVATWWNQPSSRFPFDARAGTTHLTILHDDGVAGFLEFSEEDEPDYRFASIDIYVDPARHRRGIATDALRTAIRHLVEDRGHHRITIDPATDNHAAIACYEKVGFRRVGVIEASWRDGAGVWRDGLLMEMVFRERLTG